MRKFHPVGANCLTETGGFTGKTVTFSDCGEGAKALVLVLLPVWAERLCTDYPRLLSSIGRSSCVG
jgi:hypothetical protein